MKLRIVGIVWAIGLVVVLIVNFLPKKEKNGIIDSPKAAIVDYRLVRIRKSDSLVDVAKKEIAVRHFDLAKKYVLEAEAVRMEYDQTVTFLKGDLYSITDSFYLREKIVNMSKREAGEVSVGVFKKKYLIDSVLNSEFNAMLQTKIALREKFKNEKYLMEKKLI